jgi:hypothetical protein
MSSLRVAVLSLSLATIARAASADVEPVPATAPKRATSLEPKPVTEPSGERERFIVDPYSDGAILLISGAFAGLSGAIISSGELKPQQPTDSARLSWIDRGAVTQTFDPNAALYSNIGLYGAIAYAVVDPIISGVRQQHAQTFLVDAMLYAESAMLTGALTNLTKLAIRRPRPRAYWEQERLKRAGSTEDISETDTALSFVSGHASIVAAISATATHLAFARSQRGSVRPWLTLIGGVLLTSFVGYERVRAGAHFPTDVIAGALIGAGVGVLVPHLHDDEKLSQHHVWIGFEKAPGGALGSLSLTF